MLKPMFRKHFFLTVTVFAVVAAVCLFLGRSFDNYERHRFFQEQANVELAQVQAHKGNLVPFIEDLNKANRRMHSPLVLELLDKEKKDDFGPSLSAKIMTDNGEKILNIGLFHGGFGHPRPPLEEEKPGMGPPPVGSSPFAPGGPPFLGPPLILFTTLMLAILLASGLSVLLIYRSFREKAEMAREVLGRMQKGDLKARFVIADRDEAKQMFELFNQMASEIERLIDKMREDERARVQLLQELAHDLRTPVSSIKNAVETIRFDEDKIDLATRNEIKELAFQETEYLGRLVEDLLFLALMLEPKYRSESQDVNLSELIQSQIQAASVNFAGVQPIFEDNSFGRATVTGNTHQLKRMLRNGFDNAFSFARKQVRITLEIVPEGIRIYVRDDGPGLSADSLENFGKKKPFGRFRSTSANNRPSVGLGSVIAKTIAQAHGGDAIIRNLIDPQYQTVGAELVITLATSVEAA